MGPSTSGAAVRAERAPECMSSDDESEEEEEEGEEEDPSAESSESPPPLPKLVGGHYRVKFEIGSGSYSEVYLGVDSVSGEKVAVKIEWQKAEKTGKLLGEAKLYETLGSGGDTPRILWSGTQGEYNIMVMELLGASLDDLIRKCGQFSLKTVLMLSEQIISCLEYVHDRGILYRDIKPHNFLMGLGASCNRVYIVDFGLAKRYTDPVSGEHLPCTKKRRAGVTGTVRYSSLNVHEGLDASRRDDLEATGYVLLHFLRGDLPWLGLKARSKRTKHELIRRKKHQTSDEDLCRGFPGEFVEFFRYCRALPFDGRPDYDHLRGLFARVFARMDYERDYAWDWCLEESGKPHGKKRQRSNSVGAAEGKGKD